MKGNPLIVDDESLKKLREHAEANKFSIDEMKKIVAGKAPVVGDRPGYSCNFDFGYRVVFTIEEHPLKGGKGTIWIRHMSMSQVAKGRSPHLIAMAMVGGPLGFTVKDHLPSKEHCMFQMDGEVVEMMEEIKQ